MTRVFKTLNLIVLGLLILICGLGTFYKHISFGKGLGDMFGYLVLYTATITHLILTLILKKRGVILHIILTMTFLLITILISLNATIWRGSEYSWNGSIFYLPCPTEIKIENNNTEKRRLIQMCTGEYWSEFSGIWDGEQIIIKDGEINIPNTLKTHIKKPIIRVEIETDVWQNFNKDTLRVNYDYSFSGKVGAIRNYQPVMKVSIK